MRRRCIGLHHAGADLHTRDSEPCGSVSERPSTVAAALASGVPGTPAPAGKTKDTPSPASSGARSLKRQRAEAALHSAHAPRKRLTSWGRGVRPGMLQLGPDVTVPACGSVLAFCQPPCYLPSGAKCLPFANLRDIFHVVQALQLPACAGVSGVCLAGVTAGAKTLQRRVFGCAGAATGADTRSACRSWTGAACLVRSQRHPRQRGLQPPRQPKPPPTA